MTQDEAQGPNPGPLVPPTAPHRGRRVAGSPGRPVGARREEEKKGGAETGWDSLTGAGDLGRRQKDGLAAPLWECAA